MADTTSGGMLEWVKENPTIAIGGGVVLILVIAGKFMAPKAPATGTPTADLSGLTNGIVYVPTQTNFTTENVRYGAFSNDPNLQTITNSGNTTKTVNPPPPVPTPRPPVPPPPGPRQPPPPPPKPVAKYPIPGKSPFVYRFGEKAFQWKDPFGKLWTVGFGPSGRVWGVPGSVSDAVWQQTPIPPKTLLYQD